MLERLKKMGSPNAALRMAKMKAGPVVTDNGNFVIDAPFSEEDYKDPKEVSKNVSNTRRQSQVGLIIFLCYVISSSS